MRISTPALLLLSLTVVYSHAQVPNEAATLTPRRIAIPPQFASRTVDVTGQSPASRYVDAYNSAWWQCIQRYAQAIDYQPTWKDRAGVGWSSEIEGYADGYKAAERRVQGLRTRLGPAKTQALLQQAYDRAHLVYK